MKSHILASKLFLMKCFSYLITFPSGYNDSLSFIYSFAKTILIILEFLQFFLMSYYMGFEIHLLLDYLANLM